MSVQSVALASLMSLFLVGCDHDFKGVLTLGTPLQVKTKKGQQTISAGEFAANLKIKSEKEFVLEVGSKNSDRLRIPFKKTANTKIPMNGNGEILISGAEQGQNFDIKGSLRTTFEDGPRRRDRESCEVRRSEHVCYPVGGGKVACRWETRYYPGWQTVEYFVRETREEIQTQLFKRGAAESIGRFQVDQLSRRRVYTYTGHCF